MPKVQPIPAPRKPSSKDDKAENSKNFEQISTNPEDEESNISSESEITKDTSYETNEEETNLHESDNYPEEAPFDEEEPIDNPDDTESEYEDNNSLNPY